MVVGVLCAGCDHTTSTPLRHEAYVWQRVWNPSVMQGIQNSKPFLTGWHVLLAETNLQGEWRDFSPSIPASDQIGRPLTAVVRIDGQRSLRDGTDLVARLQRLMTAQPPGRWTGLEIDYDCPSGSLDAYSEFVHELKYAIPPGLTLSVTALPTWISSRGLPNLLAAADASVLQVHSVLDPRRGLFDARMAGTWVAAYAELTDKPFYVALPDYGSRVGWDSSGHLTSVVSEQLVPEDARDQQELLADPRDVDRFLSPLRSRHPRSLIGVVWFRLPIPGDQRIWRLSTLESVVRGQPLIDRRVINVTRDQAGAYDVELTNEGSVDALTPKTVRTGLCPAADGRSDFVVDHNSTGLSFIRRDESLIRPGQRIEVGWTRCPITAEDVNFED